MDRPVGQPTIACRVACTALAFAPVVYWLLVVDGDVYHFLLLVLAAPVAGAVLALNSLWCLVRSRTWRSAWISLAFLLPAPVGFAAAWYVLPQFRM